MSEKAERGSGAMVKLEALAMSQTNLFMAKAHRMLGLKLTRSQTVNMMILAAAKLQFSDVFKVADEPAPEATKK